MVADKILKSGIVYSNKLNGERINGEAIAVADGIIVGVGTDEEMLALADDSTEIIDCNGNTIMAGLADAHLHPSLAAGLYLGCDMFGVLLTGDCITGEDARMEYLRRVQEHVKENRDNDVFRGVGWSQAVFLDNVSGVDNDFFNRHQLDEICADKPMILTSEDQHYIWVNTKAIEMAGLTSSVEDPEAGHIYREADGYPSGVFQDPAACKLIVDEVGKYSVEDYKQAILTYQEQDAVKYGITMIQDCMALSENATLAYKELAEEGKLKLRVKGVNVIDGGSPEEDFKVLVENDGKFDVGNDFRIDTAKFFLESGYAFLNDDGSVNEDMGFLTFDKETLVKYFVKVMEHGHSIHCHCMGSASVKLGVDAIEEARKLAGRNVGRETLAHISWIPDGYIEKMGGMGVICSCQPRWSILDAEVDNVVIPMIGEHLAKTQAPIGRLQKAGCMLAFGTDFPVTPPPSPWHSMQCAMTRRVFRELPSYDEYIDKICGEDSAPEIDCISLDDCMRGLTINGAYQMFLDDITGSLEIGKSADIVVLDCDLENLPVDDIYNVQVQKTFFKGKLVYEA